MLAPMGSVHRRFNKANIDALQALGYEVELVANFENGEGPEVHNSEYVASCGLKTHSIPFERHSLTGSIRCLPQLKALIAEGGYDIVHAHTETGGLLLKLCGRIAGKKVYTPHGMSFWKGSSLKSQLVYKPLERWICGGMDANLGMNMEEVENLRRWNGLSANYVHGIGLNVERMQKPVRGRDEVRSAFGVSPDCCMILSVGELDDNKNHKTVIKALASLRERDFKYVVCGVGPNKEMLLSYAAECGIAEKVVLAGYRSDIPDIVGAADVFVFPSFHEGMPVSALEAMAGGLPVVCSRIRGNVDIVVDGDNGFLFEPSDDVVLARCLARLREDSGLREAMGEKNREIVEAFSKEAVTKELVEIYKSCEGIA